MVRGQYIAATGMMLQRRRMEVVTNNIVNAETTGFKKDLVVSRSFDAVLVAQMQADSARPASIGQLSLGARIDRVAVDFSQGLLEPTDNPTDIALAGSGFFVVETPQGERYTRNSAWALSQDGYLTDGDGNFLLGESGRIFVGTGGLSVDAQGHVAGTRIRVVDFEDPSQLRKVGGNLYTSAQAPAEATDYQVRQGVLEGSNVDLAREMVDMISVYRAYETNQRMLTMIDETVGMAASDIGRLR